VHLHSYRIANYRRLQNVHIELATDISIFVGANNSGKTSATQAIHAFVAATSERFSLYDFSAASWKSLDAFGELPLESDTLPTIPAITLDLWFTVAASDLHLVVALLPTTAWEGSQVGLRIEYTARNSRNLIERYQAKRDQAAEQAAHLEARDNDKYVPWPESLTSYLRKELHSEFEFKYYVLDRTKFDEQFSPQADYRPQPLGTETNGAALLRSLVRVDSLSAQRHLADPAHSSGQGLSRAEDLSRRLSKFYKHNLDQRQADHKALRALFDTEAGFNAHLADVFSTTLERLSNLGYPGIHNPRLQIRSAINPATIMSQDTRVHYVLGDGEDAPTLPDSYNGLGFKNLIYMVVEILDAHARWVSENETRAPLHLIFIEEPEAHLHAQLQQVFIRNVLKLVKEEHEDGNAYNCQAIVTTHSPHILYERGFKPIRYFRRMTDPDGGQSTDVLNLSAFYSSSPNDRDFLERYIKLTHCDLFFADAAILVEGNVERLLLPVMIENGAESLTSASLCILEVGGAFGHKFRSLIEFLGLAALVITDLDSVVAVDAAGVDEDEDTEFEVPSHEDKDRVVTKLGRACLPSVAGALTSNQTLIQWLPKKQRIDELIAANVADKLFVDAGVGKCKVRVCYQVPTDVEWNGATEKLCGRTLEESFALENAAWCQHRDRRHLGLRLNPAPGDSRELAAGLHKRVAGKSFDKTKFALGVLTQSPTDWNIPLYIKEGLDWIPSQIVCKSVWVVEGGLTWFQTSRSACRSPILR